VDVEGLLAAALPLLAPGAWQAFDCCLFRASAACALLLIAPGARSIFDSCPCRAAAAAAVAGTTGVAAAAEAQCMGGPPHSSAAL